MLSLVILVEFVFGLVIGPSHVVLIKGVPLHIQLHAQSYQHVPGDSVTERQRFARFDQDRA